MADGSTWTPKAGPQTVFLACGAFEACTGGIVGGGKTTSLLVGALRHVHRPGYAALILRRHYTELTKADGLLERAWNLYPRCGGLPANGGLTWVWPSGARIDLAGMDAETDRFKFDGSAYQYVAFDELQTFALIQYTYLASRMRQNDRILASGPPIPLRLRSTATPGGIGHDWVVARFGPWIRLHDPEYDGPRAQPGAWLHYRIDPTTEGEVLCGADHPEAMSRCFIPTVMLEYVGAEYRRALTLLDPVTRAQRLYGDWLVRPGAGLMFQRAWFTRERGQLLDRMPHPADVLFRVRAYDLAATPKKTNEQRAATVALRMAVLRSRLLVVEHVRRLWGRPHEVEQMMKELAVSDDAFHGGPVLVSFPIDPGQSGIAQRDQLAKVLEGHSWRATPETGDKVDRAKPPSASAEGKRLAIVKGDWNEEFLREAHDFPIGKLKDQIDALSRAHRECTRGGGAATARAGGGDGKRVSMHRPGGGF